MVAYARPTSAGRELLQTQLSLRVNDLPTLLPSHFAEPDCGPSRLTGDFLAETMIDVIGNCRAA